MTVRFGKYVLREESRELLREGVPVTMTPKSFTVLQVLVQARGNVVSKAQLMATVWPDSYVDEGSVSQNIFVLRKLIGPDFPEVAPIETVARLGYRFRPHVEEVLETPPIAAATEASSKDAKPGTLLPGALYGFLAAHRTLAGVATAILLLLLAASVAFATRSRRAKRAASHDAIAILSLQNLTGSPEDAWLSIALREMLATDLTTGTGLKLLPEENVKRAQEELGLTATDGLSPETLTRLRDDLDCDQVISGSYAVHGGRIQMDLHLMDARTGAMLASYSFNQPEVRLHSLVAEGGGSLRRRLGIPQRSHGENATIEATLPISVEAYRLYVEGVQSSREYDSLHAQESLEKSIAIDPNFALSHMALATAYQMAGLQTKADAEADRAMSLSHNLSQVDYLNVQANTQDVRHQYQDAADTFHTLMGLSPDDLGYGVLYARDLINAGRSHEALVELDRLMARPGPEATDPRLYSTAADAYGTLGDWPRSLEWAEKAVEESRRRGARISYGRVLTSTSQARLYLKQYDRATAETQESLAIAHEFKDYSAELRALNRLAQIDIAQHRLNDAQNILQQALAREQTLGEQQRQIHTLSALGRVMTKKGDHAAALGYYNRAVTLATTFGQAEFLVAAQYNQAVGRRDMGDVAGAEKQLNQVVTDASRIDDKQTRLEALQTLAEVRLTLGHKVAALANIRTALQAADFDRSPHTKFRLLDLQTRTLLSQGKLPAATTSLNQEEALLSSAEGDDAIARFRQTRDLVRNGTMLPAK